MSTDRDVELHLTFDGDAVEGQVAAPGGEERPFTGWLGLLAALDALRLPPPAEPD